MLTTVFISVHDLTARREALGMSFSVLAAHSGIPEPTVKRILGGRVAEASVANLEAIARALGISFRIEADDVDDLRHRQARKKAEQIARLVQGTSGLESQAVDQKTYDRLVERSYHELLAGSKRRLWSA